MSTRRPTSTAATLSLAIAKHFAPAYSQEAVESRESRPRLARPFEPNHKSRAVIDVLTTDVAEALRHVRGVSISREFAGDERGFFIRKCRSVERAGRPVVSPGVT